MAAPGVVRFLEKKFRTLLGEVPSGFPRIFVHVLIILTAADLEHRISGVESFSLQEVLTRLLDRGPRSRDLGAQRRCDFARP